MHANAASALVERARQPRLGSAHFGSAHFGVLRPGSSPRLIPVGVVPRTGVPLFTFPAGGKFKSDSSLRTARRESVALTCRLDWNEWCLLTRAPWQSSTPRGPATALADTPRRKALVCGVSPSAGAHTERRGQAPCCGMCGWRRRLLFAWGKFLGFKEETVTREPRVQRGAARSGRSGRGGRARLASGP